jgi:hypothetical protein
VALARALVQGASMRRRRWRIRRSGKVITCPKRAGTSCCCSADGDHGGRERGGCAGAVCSGGIGWRQRRHSPC